MGAHWGQLLSERGLRPCCGRQWCQSGGPCLLRTVPSALTTRVPPSRMGCGASAADEPAPGRKSTNRRKSGSSSRRPSTAGSRRPSTSTDDRPRHPTLLETGWDQMTDGVTGDSYYWHRGSNETTRIRPAAILTDENANDFTRSVSSANDSNRPDWKGRTPRLNADMATSAEKARSRRASTSEKAESTEGEKAALRKSMKKELTAQREGMFKKRNEMWGAS